MRVPIFVLAVDHRVIMAKAASEKGVSSDRIGAFKELAVDAACAARDRRPAFAAHMAILVDDEYGGAAIARARLSGLPVGQPVEAGGVTPLAYCREDWATSIVATRPAFLKVRFEGRPDQPAAVREEPERKLRAMSDACRAHDVPFMPEPIIGPRPPREDAAAVAAFDADVRPSLTAAWMRALHDQGVVGRWWKLEGFESPAAARMVADACAPGEGIVVLGQSAPLASLERWFRATRGIDRFEGFAVGRSIFWDAFTAHLAGASPETTVAAVRDRYLEVVDLWSTTAG